MKDLTKDHRDGQRSLAREVKARSSNAFDLEFMDMVAPVGDEIIIDKTSAGTFNSTNLDQVLRNLGIKARTVDEMIAIMDASKPKAMAAE